jgi:PAS domain S-box-containing protein
VNPDLPVDRWPAHWAQLKREKVMRWEGRHRRHDGQVVPVEIMANYLEFKGREYDFAFVRDISQQRQTQDHIRQSEESLKFTQFAVDQCCVPAFRIDAEARILYANAAACLGLGYSAEELLKMRVADIDPRWTEPGWARFWAELKERRAVVAEGCQRTKDGRVFPMETSSSFLEYDGRGYCFVFAQDITLRKRSEEAQGS